MPPLPLGLGRGDRSADAHQGGPTYLHRVHAILLVSRKTANTPVSRRRIPAVRGSLRTLGAPFRIACGRSESAQVNRLLVPGGPRSPPRDQASSFEADLNEGAATSKVAARAGQQRADPSGTHSTRKGGEAPLRQVPITPGNLRPPRRREVNILSESPVATAREFDSVDDDRCSLIQFASGTAELDHVHVIIMPEVPLGHGGSRHAPGSRTGAISSQRGPIGYDSTNFRVVQWLRWRCGVTRAEGIGMVRRRTFGALTFGCLGVAIASGNFPHAGSVTTSPAYSATGVCVAGVPEFAFSFTGFPVGKAQQ